MILISSCSHLYQIHWSQVLCQEWRYSWSSADMRCSNYIWVINNLIANLGASYIRDLTVGSKLPTVSDHLPLSCPRIKLYILRRPNTLRKYQDAELTLEGNQSKFFLRHHDYR